MDSLLPLGLLLVATMLAADPTSAGHVEKSRISGEIQGSAPIISGPLAEDWIAGFNAAGQGRDLRLPKPFGPPQGKLDPHLLAFLEGRSRFAFLTREISEPDLARFRATYGTDPVVLPVAGGGWNSFGYVDPVVLIVHTSNPIRSLSFAQIDAIFSESRLRAGVPIVDWGAAGVRAWRGRPIRIAGGGGWDGEESARALSMRRTVLSVDGQIGRWRPAPGTGGEADVVARVSADPLAIGFTGHGHLGPDVRAIAIRRSDSEPPVAPTREAIASGRYPLVRTVDLLLAPDAKGCVDRALLDFARYLAGAQGQRAIGRHPPFLPLARNQAAEANRRIARAAC